jgi:hypothetical protein
MFHSNGSYWCESSVRLFNLTREHRTLWRTLMGSLIPTQARVRVFVKAVDIARLTHSRAIAAARRKLQELVEQLLCCMSSMRFRFAGEIRLRWFVPRGCRRCVSCRDVLWFYLHVICRL